MKTSKRYHLRARKRKELANRIPDILKVDVPQITNKKVKTEILEFKDGTQIIVFDEVPTLIVEKETFFPTLLNTEVLSQLSKITVDMGAVPYICNGAHLMAPGITNITGDFDEGDIIVIIEERHAKPLAIGRTLCNSSQMADKRSGKVALNLHYIGDTYWTFLTNL